MAAVVARLLRSGVQLSSVPPGSLRDVETGASAGGCRHVGLTLLAARTPHPPVEPREEGATDDTPPALAEGDAESTALHAAAACGSTRLCRAIMDAGADVDAVGGGSAGGRARMALADACAHGHVDVVHLLLSAGADVHGGTQPDGPLARDARDRSPICAALHAGREDVVRVLLAHGATLPTTALLDTCETGSVPTASVLARLGVAMGGADARGVTPLHAACKAGRERLVAWLLAQGGVDVHARTARGDTPLHVAAAACSGPCVRLLLSAGADASAVDAFGRTASVVGRSSVDVVEALALSSRQGRRGGRPTAVLVAARGEA